MGVKVSPLFVVFHSPPAAMATYHTCGFFGSTAMSALRPDVNAGPTERNRSAASGSVGVAVSGGGAAGATPATLRRTRSMPRGAPRPRTLDAI